MQIKLHLIFTFLFAFLVANVFAQIPNSGFENWTTAGSYENLNSWGTPNDACSGPFYRITKSTDNYPTNIGTYSMKIESNTALLPGFCAYGYEQTQVGTNGTTQFSITGHPTSLTGYYKFAPLNGDTMGILVLLYNAGVQQSVGSFSTSVAASNWTSFNIPFSTYTTADSASIVLSTFYLSPVGHPVPHGNSVLYVDNLNFDNLITGIAELNKTNNVSVYPNPTNTQFTIETNASEKQIVNIFDVNGKLVLTQTIYGTTNVDASNFNAGIYNLSLISNAGVLNKRLVIVK